jgi:predicted dehydrogenase
MGKIINVGIAGFGRSARVFHIPLLKTNKHFAIRAVLERSSDTAKRLCPEAVIVRNFQDMLSQDIDLIVICTPNGFHYEMAKEALLANKNVVVEKPFTINSCEAWELCELAKEKNVVLSVFQNRRWDGDFLTAKKIIQNGLLGKIVNYEAHYDRYAVSRNPVQWKEADVPGSGVLYDLGIHIADQAVMLFGMPGEVYADLSIQRENSLIVDYCYLALYYPTMKVALSMSKIVREQGPRIAVHGTLGSYVKYGLDPQEAALQSGATPAAPFWGTETRESWGILNTEINGAALRCAVETERGDYPAYYQNIYEAILGQAELLVTPEQAWNVLRIVEAAMKSQETRRRVSIS